MQLTFVQVFHRRTEGDAHEVMANGVEKVATMRGVDVEEDTRDNDRLLLKKFLEERLRDA